MDPLLCTSLIHNSLAPGARIVNIASAAHAIAPLRIKDYSFGANKDNEKWMAYGYFQSANILFSTSIGSKWPGIEAFAVNPGGAPRPLHRWKT